MTAPLPGLVARLELDDEEALVIFELNALEAIGGRLEHRPEVAILDAITSEAAGRLGEGALARWIRAGRPGVRPVDLLLAGDFGAFEARLAQRVAEAG